MEESYLNFLKKTNDLENGILFDFFFILEKLVWPISQFDFSLAPLAFEIKEELLSLLFLLVLEACSSCCCRWFFVVVKLCKIHNITWRVIAHWSDIRVHFFVKWFVDKTIQLAIQTPINNTYLWADIIYVILWE